jgi:hypothetical protein
MAITMKYVRKGTRVMLRNGWEAEVLDNLTNRATRMCKVFGTYTEMGSVYSSDIVSAVDTDGVWHVVVHSTKTLQRAKARQSWGF